MITDNEYFTFTPETDSLIFGNLDNSMILALLDEIKQKKTKELFIDLRRNFLISSLGIELLIDIIEKIRILDVMPYVITTSHMSLILKDTLLGRIIRIVNNFKFERENTSQVEELEKDMLWNFF